MYSDNHYTDVFDGGLDLDVGNTFGLSGDILSDAFYTNANPVPQTLPRHQHANLQFMKYSGAEDDIPVGNSMLGSPQPMTVKKLKTHLSGVGGEGGYLTSPMGISKGMRNNEINMLTRPGSAVGMGISQRAFLEETKPFQMDIQVPSLNAPTMQRLRSAPPSIPAPYQFSSSSSSLPYVTRPQAPQNNSKSSNAGLGIPSQNFSDLDYGSMRIYGRPLQRSASEDPVASSSAGSSGFLPYPEHLPTTTLGRGVKNARNIYSSSQHESFPVKQESIPPTPSYQPNVEKPFIQYVPPNSPAAKSAARNKRHLTIKTENGKPSQKLVAIRMKSPWEAPLSPPQSCNQTLSSTLQLTSEVSPVKMPCAYSSAYVNAAQSIPIQVPSFEFSLEQFSGGEYRQTNGALTENDHFDLNALLGLPTPGIDSCSSVPSSRGLLSPPHSAASTHSSVFSSEEEMMYGLPPSPFFDQPNAMSHSIDQALASLLDSHQLSSQPLQQASPRAQHLGQVSVGSPPQSPRNAPVSSQLQWSPYHQQSNSPNQFATYIDPSLHQINNNNVNNLLLSPQSANYYQNADVGGRPISSPRRLRCMQSAPNLGQVYNDPLQNVLRSPSSRKTSLKRQRSYYSSEGEEEDVENAENLYANGRDDSLSDLDGDDEYQPDRDYELGPPSKRRPVSSGPYSDQNTSPHFASINLNPSRLRPGPKPKSSLPNLQAVHQSVFTVAHNAPPIPSLPPHFATFSDNLAIPVATSPRLSPDDLSSLAKAQGANVSKDMLANFYSVGTGAKQTKKGKPQRMYICSIPGCLKEFPRKSAVESHIQTHLEDKPFCCPYDEW